VVGKLQAAMQISRERDVGADGGNTDAPTASAVAALVARERSVPLGLLGVLVFSWCLVLFLALLKGGHGGAPLLFPVPCGGAAYWALLSATLAAMTIVTALVAWQLHVTHTHKVAVRYTYLEGDVAWAGHHLRVLPALSVAAGVAAGLLGIGGGMVTGPLMLELGVHPQVACATAACMVLFTSSSTTAQFVIAGMLRLDYAVWYGSVGVLATIIGQSIAVWYIRTYNRQSVIILALGLVIGVSGIAMGAVGAIDVVAHAMDGEWAAFTFHNLCDA